MPEATQPHTERDMSGQRCAVSLKRHRLAPAILFAAAFSSLPAFAGQDAPAKQAVQPADPHYTSVGFFDIHVCNWPGRPLFFMALFSTTHFQDVLGVRILGPDGSPLGELDLEKYRYVLTDDKREKRVFIKQFEIPGNAADGWYTAEIRTRDAGRIEARDYVIIHSIEVASGANPPGGAENVPMPSALTWEAIPGAKHYQVFLRDEWEARVILSSDVLDKPKLDLPAGLLQAGGEYTWRIHARDVNGNALLGDFNHGSLTGKLRFSVADN